MKNLIIVPFDLNTARKIKSGEIEGSVLIDNIEIEFVYESKDCADRYNLLFVKKDGSGISAIYADTEGCALGDTTLELRVEAGAYFKEGDILTSTKGCQFIYDGLITEGATDIVGYEYKLLYHERFFEHLHMKRLVIDENIPFPVSTWERSYKYKGYGYNMCRETKKKLLQALKGVNVEEEDVSLYTTGGWD